MGYTTEEELLKALMQAYYVERDIDKIMEIVTDDVEWIGTEHDDTAFGKQELRELLVQNILMFPGRFDVEIEDIRIRKIAPDTSRITVIGKQVTTPGMNYGFSMRVTACSIRQEDGTYLLDSIHASVPNAEMERYILEQELNETRKKERTLMTSIPGGIAIYRMKKDGRAETEYVSDSFSKIMGYLNHQDMLKRVQEDALAEVRLADRKNLQKHVLNSIKNHTPISETYYIYTKDHKLKEVRMDANVILESQLKEDEIAVIYAVHTLVSDETKQKEKEQERYRFILNMLGLAYWEWSLEDGDFCSEKYNDYAISELERMELIENEEYKKYVHPDDVAIAEEYMFGESKVKQKSAVMRAKMKDGSYRWTELFSYVDSDTEGNMTHIISVMRDVDKGWLIQKKQLEQALLDEEKANRAKTDFLSRVSHDMRTPLNGILGTTVLMLDYVKDEKIREDLLQLEQSGKYLLNLINDTLDVSKIEKGKLELNPVVCDGRTVLKNVLDLIAPNMKEKEIDFQAHTEALKFSVLYIDVGRVEQIIMNILGNSVKFTPRGGKIDFTMTNLSIENGVITDQVVIEDNGVGMSEEYLPRIFEPFSQERNTTTSSSRGTGLGMTITKQIIDLMGGTIFVESKLGKGTRFTFTLPMKLATKEQVLEWKKGQEPGTAAQGLLGKRILLCEDHPLNATIAERLLQSKGIIVERAENGELGLNQFQNSEPGFYDAVLMDIRMPVMNGLDAAKAIRQLNRPDAATIPIIAMTANALSSDIRETKEAGMNAHLSKPVEPALLFETLAEYI